MGYLKRMSDLFVLFQRTMDLMTLIGIVGEFALFLMVSSLCKCFITGSMEK